jgi:hypothetical protein
MTAKTQCFIELTDIIGIRCECKQCGTILLIEPTSIGKALAACPKCLENWALLGDKSDYSGKIVDLWSSLLMLQKIRDRIGFALTLEINVDVVKPSSLQKSEDQR